MKFKRLMLCSFLSLALVVTFIPAFSFAQDEEGTDESAIEEIVPTTDVEAVINESEDPVLEAKDIKITSVSLSINQPICGTVVTGTESYDWEDGDGTIYRRQIPQPVVSIPTTAMYELCGNDNENYGVWHKEDGNDFQGVINASETYLAVVVLQRKESYAYFKDEFELSNVHVTGGTPIDCYSYGGYVLEITIKVKPVHNYAHTIYGTGYLTNGIECDKCRGCGVEINRRSAGGYSTNYVKSLKVKKAKGSFTVKWKKQNKKNLKKFDGYEIRYSTGSNINAAKAITVSKKSKSKKIGKLARKTNYYVWVSSYKYVNGVKNYSNWSRKTVKTK